MIHRQLKLKLTNHQENSLEQWLPTLASIPGLGKVKFHKQTVPEGKIKGGRAIKRASGWYLCLFIDTCRRAKLSRIHENLRRCG